MPDDNKPIPLRKGDGALAENLRELADQLEAGQIRGLMLVYIIDGQSTLKAMCDHMPVQEFLGSVELELFTMKHDIAVATRKK